MKLINRKNFLPMVCIIYTLLSIFKVISESILNGGIDKNQGNFIWIMAMSIVATFVISLHYYLQDFSIWLVIIGQYIILITFVMICIWIEGHFVELHPDAYKDMFRSFTIPYIVGAAIYYFKFCYEVRKANVILKNLKARKDR